MTAAKTVIILLAAISGLKLVGGQDLVECYVDGNCQDETVPLRMTRRECCLRNDTVGFKLEGEELCTICVVFGWMSGPIREVEGASYSTEVGYIKGALEVQEFLEFRLGLQAQSVSASDFTLNTSTSDTIFVDFRPNRPPNIVTFTFHDDDIAQEGMETAVLTLESTTDLSLIFALGSSAFFLDELPLSIIDTDVLEVAFTQDTYTANESELELSVAVTKGKTIANPVVLQISPQTLQEASSSNLPVGAPSAGLEDFDSAPLTVTFAADEGQTLITQQSASITIEDDSISESSQEFFLVSVNVSEAADLSTINTPPSSISIIEDNEVLIVEWEQANYIALENETRLEVCFNITGAESIEGTSLVTVMTSTKGEPPNAATAGEDYRSISEAIDLSLAAGLRGCVNIEIIDDRLALEAEEQFFVQFDIQELSRLRSIQLGSNSEACVTIIDNDILEVEWEASTLVFNEESSGEVPVCFSQNTPSAMDITLVIVPAPKSNNTAIRDVDYSIEPSELSITLNSTTSRSLICIPITIIDDVIGLEGEEQFTLFFEGLPNGEVGVGANSEVCVTIIDNDVPVISWEQGNYTAVEGQEVDVCFGISTGFAQELEFSVETAPKGVPPFSATPERDYITLSFRADLPPSSEPIGGFCLPITITDDVMALEEDEQLLVRFNLEQSPLVLGSVPEACVTITDNDVLVVEWEESAISVPENISQVDICFRTNANSAVNVSILVGVEPKSDNPATEGEDYLEPSNLMFFLDEAAASEQFCVTLPVLDDTAMFEGIKQLRVFFVGLPNGQVSVGTNAEVCVSIVDDDVQNETTCVIDEPLRVKPFAIDNRYHFLGSCEHYVLRSCNETQDSPSFFVVVDFLTANLATGAVLVYQDGNSWISRENGSLSSSLEDAIETMDDDENTLFNFTAVDTIVTIGDGYNVIEVGGGVDVVVVHQYSGEDSFFEIRVTRGSSLIETCGLCGTQRGDLLQLDGTIASLGNMAEVETFSQSYLVPAALQELRPQRRECATLGNDTVIGDPLYTVPILSVDGNERAQLCYEVRGRPDTIFNLISDTCVSVNAYYSPAFNPELGNFIGQIAVRAVGNSGQCYNIHVARDGCTVSMSSVSSNVEDFIAVDDRYLSDGVSIRKYPTRVRIVVPNCENVMLVMWVTCETRNSQDMIRFDISRGLNLRQTSHGLIGQFWNIALFFQPVTVTLPTNIRNPGTYYEVTISSSDARRNFLATRSRVTWEKKEEECLYAGSAQGGRSGEVPEIDDPVVEGRYFQYQLDELFGTRYIYSQFEEDRCTSM